ncbi:hypothetical protein E2C01_057494 [Portunus trituberculatus]|uniref:Uncharacterized protein n=1 Tax=Portunus trituberculatus TaxID=210409 RepID=A0A5B7H0M3_PORTR|nr:hypothetical protein [Portunus trituberculatus]
MMSLLKLRDSRDFSPYSSSTEWADEDEGEAGGSKPSNTLLSALSEADVEGPAVAGSARLTGLKKEDMEEGPTVAGSAHLTGLTKGNMEEGSAVEPLAADVEGPAVAGSAGVTGTACLTGLKNE